METQDFRDKFKHDEYPEAYKTASDEIVVSHVIEARYDIIVLHRHDIYPYVKEVYDADDNVAQEARNIIINALISVSDNARSIFDEDHYLGDDINFS